MTPVTRILLAANVGAFFLQMVQPGIVSAFVYVPALTLVRPWTLVTYMFLHGGLMHLVFNMLGLFFFGPRVEDRLGSRQFGILYFVSGIAGAVLSLALSPRSPILGASAAVFGVMLAFAYFWPREPILIWGVLPVPARVLVIITTVLALYSGFGGVRSGIAHFAHLGGYAGAFLYLKWLERSRGAWRRRSTALPKTAARVLTRRPVIDMTTVHEANRAEINRLLDKISAGGVTSLSPEERLFLSNFATKEES
ncbi:MAG: rhomboid family intramembrane serine protease [Gemmatimonadaceae bacterium]